MMTQEQQRLLAQREIARERWRWRYFTVLSAILTAAVLLGFLGGCAALPMPMQPKDMTYNTNTVEGTWLVVDAVDTAQTMHIKKGTTCDHEGDPFAQFLYRSENPPPARVLGVNLGLMLVHTMVTSWFDDKVAEHAKDDTEGLWFSGRFAWEALSLTLSGASVMHNATLGCPL